MDPAPGDRELARSIEEMLSGISTTTNAITRFVRSVRSAHTELSLVTHELSDLRLALELLRDETAIPQLLRDAHILTVLDACADALVRIDIVLEHCVDSTQWLTGPSQDIATQRAELAKCRQALSLVLEAVTLSTSRGNQSDVDATIIRITAQVGHMRARQASAGDSTPWVEGYVDAVVQCVEYLLGRPLVIPVPTESDGPEAGLEVLRPEEERPSAPEPQRQASGSSVDQDLGQTEPSRAWSPQPATPLSHYSPYPISLEHLRRMRESQEVQQQLDQIQRLPHAQQAEQLQRMQQLQLQQIHQPGQGSPILRPAFSPSPAAPSSPLPPPPGFRPSWTSSPSPVLESFASRKLSESPILQPERWGDQYAGPGHAPSSSITSVHSRNTSTASTSQPAGSIRSNSSGLGHMSNFSQASTIYPFGSASPPSIPSSATPAPPFDYKRPGTPRSATPYSVTFPPPAKPFSPHLIDVSALDPSGLPALDDPAPPEPPARLVIAPLRTLAEKGKSQDIAHIHLSPAGDYLATRHTSKYLKIWSVPRASVFATIKTTSYVTPQPRSREYFVRSHAILSENAGLIGISTHFGFTLEIYNFSKGGSSAKKVQVIDDAHRWAASQLDAYHTNYAPLVVYRPKGDRIDRFFLARHPGAKKPFWEDTTNGIDLVKANLPFLPKFPELAYSANSPLLIAAAGPRPGEPPRPFPTLLVAWQMSPVSDTKLQSCSPGDTMLPKTDDAEAIHRPYRVYVPEYAALQTALPTCLAAHGDMAVSIWIPANHTETQLPGNKYKRKPMPAPERFVLAWDVADNSTRIFAIPNVQACISPDCRRVAYCDANAGRFVVLDVATGEEVWRSPDAARTSVGQLENLHKVTVFEFSADGRTLMVGDASGGVGMYSVREVPKRPTVPMYELADSAPGTNRFSNASMYVPLGFQEPKVSELET